MLELFLRSVEDALGLLVSPPLAPIVRMDIVIKEIDQLKRDAVEHCVEPTGAGLTVTENDTSGSGPACTCPRSDTDSILYFSQDCAVHRLPSQSD